MTEAEAMKALRVAARISGGRAVSLLGRDKTREPARDWHIGYVVKPPQTTSRSYKAENGRRVVAIINKWLYWLPGQDALQFGALNVVNAQADYVTIDLTSTVKQPR